MLPLKKVYEKHNPSLLIKTMRSKSTTCSSNFLGRLFTSFVTIHLQILGVRGVSSLAGILSVLRVSCESSRKIVQSDSFTDRLALVTQHGGCGGHGPQRAMIMRSLWPRGLSGLGGECPTCYTILVSKDIQEDLMETSQYTTPNLQDAHCCYYFTDS